jgi:hypothetical protein
MRMPNRKSAIAPRLLLFCLTALLAGHAAFAQVIGEPPLPGKQKRQKVQHADLEWMWQYSPPPEDGREHELLQDPNFVPFLHEYFKAPQSFWGPGSEGSATAANAVKTRKSLADTVYDFLAIPGRVIADDNRYITVTGQVFHFQHSRGLVFADLDSARPLVCFAAIDWIRESHAVTEPDAEYTLWIFPDQIPGTPQSPYTLPPPLLRSLKRWMATPVPGTTFPQKITHAILVDPDGNPHEIAVPDYLNKPAPPEGPQLPKRKSP